MSKEGVVVTNKHVVLDTEANYTVLTNDGERYDAEILARNPIRDIALLKIDLVADASEFNPAALGDSDSLRLGQTAIAIGNALGEFRNTVSVGVVSGLSRTVTAFGDGFVETIEGVIQTDAAINKGNSGGPLLNLKGEVIGMNTAIVSGAQNIGFAIPINHVKRDIESVRRSGSISIPYLGVRYITITPEIAKEWELSVERGALVRGTQEGPAVLPGSPAVEAGIRAEDIILAFDEEKITSERSLGSIIQDFNVGDVVLLTILRDGEELSLQVMLAEFPDLY